MYLQRIKKSTLSLLDYKRINDVMKRISKVYPGIITLNFDRRSESH